MRFAEWITGTGSLSQTLANSPNMQLPWIGYRIFKWLLLVIVLFFGALLLYAWQSYPTSSDVATLLGEEASGAERLAAVESARSAWVTSVKDFGQMFVLTPLFPLLGAVVGYIFGVSRQRADGDAADATTSTGAQANHDSAGVPVTDATTSKVVEDNSDSR